MLNHGQPLFSDFDRIWPLLTTTGHDRPQNEKPHFVLLLLYLSLFFLLVEILFFLSLAQFEAEDLNHSYH